MVNYGTIRLASGHSENIVVKKKFGSQKIITHAFYRSVNYKILNLFNMLSSFQQCCYFVRTTTVASGFLESLLEIQWRICGVVGRGYVEWGGGGGRFVVYCTARVIIILKYFTNNK